MKRRAPANLFEECTLASKLVEDLVGNAPEVVEGDADDVAVTMADALKETRENTEYARVEL